MTVRLLALAALVTKSVPAAPLSSAMSAVAASPSRAAASSASSEDFTLTASKDALQFANNALELRVDRNDGVWRGLIDRKSRTVVMRAASDCTGLDFTLNGGWVCESGKQRTALGDKGLDLAREWRFRTDPQDLGEKEGWAKPDFQDSAWQTLRVPGSWESQGVTSMYPGAPAPEWLPYNGYAWYRTLVTIPSGWPKGDLTLYLGAIDDLDWVYLNGQLVGKSTDYEGDWWAKPRAYTVPAHLVRWGEGNTIAVHVYDRGGDGGIVKGPVFLAPKAEASKVLAGGAAAARSPWKYMSHRLDRGQGRATLIVDSGMPGWRLTQRFTLRRSDPVVERCVRLENVGGAKGVLRYLRLTADGLCIGEPGKCFYRVLANYPPADVRLDALTPGRRVAQQWGSSIGNFVLLHNASRQLSLVANTYSDEEHAWAEVTEGKGAIRVDGLLAVVCRAEQNKVLDVGTQFIAVADGDLGAALRACHRVYDRVGLRPPTATQDQAARAIIYSAHPGGTIDSGFQDVGGYSQFAKLLPSLRDLGVNVLWFLPIWKGPVYAPDDYYALDERLGSVAECKLLVDQAHALGIRVLLDLVPHGPRDVSGLHLQHPDWVSRKQDGELMYWWGCLSCDYAHPGWQQYMGEHAAYWVKQVGVDGYRVDCAGGGPENWSPYGGNRPSMSNQWGGLGVLASARREMEKVKLDPLLLAEAAGPAFFRSANWTYDWPLCLDILRRIDDEPVEQFVPHVRQWLQNTQYAFPREGRLMRFLENHDTLRSALVYGPARMRALMALIAFSRGTPLLYEEQEVGHRVFLRELLALRKKREELTLGEADYLAVRTSDPAVFAVMRTCHRSQSVGVANLRPTATTCTLALPVAALQDKSAREAAVHAVGSQEVIRLIGTPRPGVEVSYRVKLRPYEAALIALGPGPPTSPPSHRASPPLVGTRPRVKASEDAVTVENGIYRLVVDKQSGGLVRSLGPAAAPEAPILTDMAFGQGSRRFWLGSGRLEISGDALRELTSQQSADEVAIVAKGELSRTIGGRTEPTLNYQVCYSCNTGSDIRVAYSLAPRIDLSDVRASLTETLRFANANRWYVRTLEGELLDDAVLRHPKDIRYEGRYWHGWGDALWQARLLPLDDRQPVVAAIRDDDYVAVTELRGLSGLPEDVRLKERHGKVEGLHLCLDWLSGEHATSLRKDRTYEVGYTLRVGRGSLAMLRASVPQAREREPLAGPATVRFTSAGSAWLVENTHYAVLIKRSEGGMIKWLKATGAPAAILRDMCIYSDRGLYGDYTDPSGNKVQTHASSRSDPEPDVRVERTEGCVRLSFRSFFRHSYAGGLSVIGPRTEYRITSEFDETPVIRVRCAVRPHVQLPDAQVFMANIVNVADFDQWAVADKDGVSRGTATEAVGRLWESRTKGFAAKPVMVMIGRESNSYVLFTDMQFCPSFQNAFVHGRRGAGTAFLAFFDGSPADLEPRWYEIAYAMRVGRGGLTEALREAGLS